MIVVNNEDQIFQMASSLSDSNPVIQKASTFNSYMEKHHNSENLTNFRSENKRNYKRNLQKEIDFFSSNMNISIFMISNSSFNSLIHSMRLIQDNKQKQQLGDDGLKGVLNISPSFEGKNPSNKGKSEEEEDGLKVSILPTQCSSGESTCKPILESEKIILQEVCFVKI